MLPTIVAAIQQKRTLSVDYGGRRVIEPHAVGESSAGDLVLRAFQIGGFSETGEVIGWKLFRLDRMRSVNDNGGSFFRPRTGYRRGDRAMRRRIIAEL